MHAQLSEAAGVDIYETLKNLSNTRSGQANLERAEIYDDAAKLDQLLIQAIKAKLDLIDMLWAIHKIKAPPSFEYQYVWK